MVSVEKLGHLKAALEGFKAAWTLKSEDVPLSVKAIIVVKGKVLLLRDARSEFWDLPGGHVKEGETLLEALAREVKEETGLTLIGPEELGSHGLILGGVRRAVTFYRCGCETADIVLSKEHEKAEWVDASKFTEYNLGVFLPVLQEYAMGVR